MSFDLILKNARPVGFTGDRVDIGISGRRIAAIQANLEAECETIDLDNRLVSPGLVETHIHLDKSRILDRCVGRGGGIAEAIAQAAKAKAAFTPEDVYTRARQTLDAAVLQGTTHMRTHLEVDPGIGLRGLEGVLPLIQEYKWAIDLEICVFAQEGLTNNPGTEELMIEALKRGCRLVGGAPYTDTAPKAQIDRIYDLARQFGVDIDMHLDFGETTDDLDVEYVCRMTDKFRYGGRVAIGHVTKLTRLPVERFDQIARALANSGVAVTVLPSTDLYLMGRQHRSNQDSFRGVVPAHKLVELGVNCSLSNNNVLNPFTPYGDCSLVHAANLYANICHAGDRHDVNCCFDMITRHPAKLMRIDAYGIGIGKAADLIVLDTDTPDGAIREVAQVLYAFKAGRKTVTRPRATLHRPVDSNF